MKNRDPFNKNLVPMPSRRQRFITCPHCWTDQRTDRDFCYRCGAEFIYLDEVDPSRPLSDIHCSLPNKS